MNKKNKIISIIFAAFIMGNLAVLDAKADYAATQTYSCPSGGVLNGSSCTVSNCSGNVTSRCTINCSCSAVAGNSCETGDGITWLFDSNCYATLQTLSGTGTINGTVLAPGAQGTGSRWVNNPVVYSNYNADVTYSCPSGGILSGTTCLTPVNGSCGTAQRTFAYTESSWGTYSACAMGSGSLPAFPAQGSSASWTCSGLNGGTSAPCTATRQAAPVNGHCGSANGTTGATQPTSGFCTAGSYSGISGTGPWNWSCIGSGGGTTAACSANKSTPVNGVCTTPPNGSAYTTLLAGSCTQGTYANFTGSGPWSWQCLGSSGGSDANCSATLLVVNGSCGSTSGTSSKTAPTSGFCNTGTFSGLAGTGPWTWSCTGSGGGTTANTCFQDKSLDGACGTDNTKTFANYPSANACLVGSPTLKTQDATSWTWNCSGVGTGAIASSDCIGFKAPATGASGWREVAP